MNNASENNVNTWEQNDDQDQLQGPTNRLGRTDPPVVDQEQLALPLTVPEHHYDPYQTNAGHHNYHTSYHQPDDQKHLSRPPNQLRTHPLAGVPEQTKHIPSYRSPPAIFDRNYPNHVIAGPPRYFNSHHPPTVPMSTAGVSIATEISGVTYNSYNSNRSTLNNQGTKTVIKNNSTTTNITTIVTWLYPFKPIQMITDHLRESVWKQDEREQLTNKLVIHDDKNYLSLLHPNLEGKDNTVEPYFLFTPKKNRIIKQEQADRRIEDDDHEEHLQLYEEFIALARLPGEHYKPPARNHKKKNKKKNSPIETELAKVKHICYLAKNLGNRVEKPTARDILDQLTSLKNLEKNITITIRKYLERLVEKYFLGCIKFLDLRGGCLNGDSFTTRSTYSDIKNKTKTSLLAAKLFLQCHKTVLPTLLEDSNLELIMERAMKFRLLCFGSDPKGKNYDINNSFRDIFKLQADQLIRIPDQNVTDIEYMDNFKLQVDQLAMIPDQNVTDIVNANNMADILEEIPRKEEVVGCTSQQYIQAAPLMVDSHKTPSETVKPPSEMVEEIQKKESPGKVVDSSSMSASSRVDSHQMSPLRVDSHQTTNTVAASHPKHNKVAPLKVDPLKMNEVMASVSSDMVLTGSQKSHTVAGLINLLTASEFENESPEGITTNANTMEVPRQYYTPAKNRERGNWEGKLDIIQIGKKMEQDYMHHSGDNVAGRSGVTFRSVFSLIDHHLSTPTFSGPRMVDRILNGNTVKESILVGSAFPGREPGSLARADFQRLERDPSVMEQSDCEHLCYLNTQLLNFGTEYAFFGTTFMENKQWCPLPVDIYSMLDKYPNYKSGTNNDSSVATLLTKYLGETVADNLLDYDVVDFTVIDPGNIHISLFVVYYAKNLCTIGNPQNTNNDTAKPCILQLDSAAGSSAGVSHNKKRITQIIYNLYGVLGRLRNKRNGGNNTFIGFPTVYNDSNFPFYRIETEQQADRINCGAYVMRNRSLLLQFLFQPNLSGKTSVISEKFLQDNTQVRGLGQSRLNVLSLPNCWTMKEHTSGIIDVRSDLKRCIQFFCFLKSIVMVNSDNSILDCSRMKRERLNNPTAAWKYFLEYKLDTGPDEEANNLTGKAGFVTKKKQPPGEKSQKKKKKVQKQSHDAIVTKDNMPPPCSNSTNHKKETEEIKDIVEDNVNPPLNGSQKLRHDHKKETEETEDIVEGNMNTFIVAKFFYKKLDVSDVKIKGNEKLLAVYPFLNFGTGQSNDEEYCKISFPGAISNFDKNEIERGMELFSKTKQVQKLLSENSTGISNTEFVQAEIEHCLNKRVKIRKKDPSGGKFQWFYGTIVNICENTNKKGDLLETVLFDDSKADSIKINCRDAHRAVYDYQNHIGHNKNGPPKTNVWHNLQKIEQFVFRYSDCKFPPFPDKPEDPRTSDQKFFCSVCDGDLNGFVQCSNMTEYNKKAKTANCYFSFDESCILKDDNSVAMSHQFKYQSQNFKQNLVNLNTKRNERADCTEPNRHQMFLDRTFGSLKNPQHGAVAYYCKKCPDDNAKVCICYQCLEHKRQLVKQHEELLRRKERLQKLKSNHNGKRAYPNRRRDGVNRSKRMRLTRRKK